MLVTKKMLLDELPPFNNEWVMVAENQTVPDIIALILQRHADFTGDYDLIGQYFGGSTIEETCDNLVNFCKKNIRYKEETDEMQTVGGPASILERGEGDCKHYSCFIGGCLDAISRQTGKKIDWHYCFASYELLKTTPYHVFVVVNTRDGEIYADPTPGADGVQPVWMENRKPKKRRAVVNGLGALIDEDFEGIGAVGVTGTLIPAPAWYPGNLPKFYRQSNGQILLQPLNSVPNYTENDVIDCLLYLQTIIGYNRADWMNARSAAWAYSDGSGSAKISVECAFKADARGNGSGDFANISPNKQSIDGALYAKLQARYIQNEVSRPWLAAMQGKGGGIQLETIPMATDAEISRPAWYSEYLPSLFVSAGEPYQFPAGSLNTKPKIRGAAIPYTVTPLGVAQLMVYAQPVIYAGPAPYPLNWYINDEVNGAMAMYFKITTAFEPGHTNRQEQDFGISGDLMKQPALDENPFTSGFSSTLETIVKAAVSFFAGKVPGGTKLLQAAYTAGTITGGEYITGGPMPAGVFSGAVFQAAEKLQQGIAKKESSKKVLWIVLAALAAVGIIYQDEIKRYFKNL